MPIRTHRVRSFLYLKKKMASIAERLRELAAEMEATDKQLQQLIDDHKTSTTASLQELKNLLKD